jgi:hypothetical protein
MKHLLRLMSVLILLAAFLPIASVSADATASGTPTFKVISVVPDSYVTIQTYNFPKSKDFVVLMGSASSLGIRGTHVAGFNTGTLTSDTYRFEIADSVRGLSQIAIRLENKDVDIYISRIFLNIDNGYGIGGPIVATTTPSSRTYITITSVTVDDRVSLKVYKLPSGETFRALLGEYGTAGVNGTVVDTFDSGSGGTISMSLSIPDSLEGDKRIAVRIESTTSSTAASSWFYNNEFGTGGPVTADPIAGIPTIAVSSVVEDSTATVTTDNFPANDTFDVYINDFGTLGIGGEKVDTISSGSGGSISFTVTIPDSMKGKSRLAIRTQSSSSGYFSYNWFWNSTH